MWPLPSAARLSWWQGTQQQANRRRKWPRRGALPGRPGWGGWGQGRGRAGASPLLIQPGRCRWTLPVQRAALPVQWTRQFPDFAAALPIHWLSGCRSSGQPCLTFPATDYPAQPFAAGLAEPVDVQSDQSTPSRPSRQRGTRHPANHWREWRRPRARPCRDRSRASSANAPRNHERHELARGHISSGTRAGRFAIDTRYLALPRRQRNAAPMGPPVSKAPVAAQRARRAA